MAMIKGMSIVLINEVQEGLDPFKRPICREEEEVIENVLVVPSSADDIVTSQDLYGKKAVYTLGIPKGDAHDWEDRRVKFFGKEWRTFGFPMEGIEENIPLDWNKKVMVERYG